MSLQIWLPLNGDYRNQGLSDVTFTASGTSVVTNDGKMGSCVSSGGSGYLISDNLVDLGQNQSMFCWIKPAAFNSSSSLTGVCGQHRYHRCTGMGITLKYASATTGYLCIAWGNGSSRYYNHHPGATLLTANNWYHVGYTYDGTTVRLYVNGNLDASYQFSDIATPADYFQCFLWSLATSGGSIYNGYGLSGKLNDIRAYDHTLSTKEIKELAKGKMLHYTFNNGGYDGMTNIILSPEIEGPNSETAWDTSLHPGAVTIKKGWWPGYKSNVASPNLGYHAYWKEENGIPIMVFPKMNYSVSGVSADRWLGISTKNWENDNRFALSNIGTTYTVSFEAKADAEGTVISGGHYYPQASDGNWNLWDGLFYTDNLPIGKWKKYSFTFTTQKQMSTSSSSHFSEWYVYGYSGSNGYSYVRNLQIEIGNTAHDYAPIIKSKDTIIYDSAGMKYDASITGTLISQPEFASDSSDHRTSYSEKNYYSAKFNGSTYVAYDKHIAIPDTYTMAFWFKKQGGGHIIDWRAVSGEAGVQPAYMNPGTNRIQYFSSAGGSSYFDYVFADNTWYHMALVVTMSTVTLYVNGVAQQTINATNPAGTLADLHIGCRASYTNIMNMNMKDFRIYSTALTESDIKQLYATPMLIDNRNNIFMNALREGDS
jgi:hypothetical protein